MVILGVTVSLAIFWIVAAVIFALIEAFTMGLTTIWFAGGALVAAVSTLFGASFIIQIVIFLAVSILLIYLTKPLKKKLKIGQEKTNINAIVGKTGFMAETASPAGFGQVKVEGQMWTAMSANPNETIESGVEITVAGVEGVKLIVVPKNY